MRVRVREFAEQLLAEEKNNFAVLLPLLPEGFFPGSQSTAATGS